MAFALTLLCLAASPGAAHAEFHFAETARRSDDVYLWPGSLHLGYGHTGDAERGAHAFTLGLDVGVIAYDALLIDVVSARVAFRNACAERIDACGTTADFFIGSRVAYAGYLGDEREHQFSVGGGLGWGEVGGGFGGRPGTGDGQLLMSLSLRYAGFGVLGLEVAVVGPLTDPIGRNYPVALMINLYGVAGLLVAALAGGF